MPRPKKEHFSYITKLGVYRKRGTINGTPYQLYAATEDELRKKIAELRKRSDLGLILNDKTTFATLAKTWFENREKDMTFNSRREARCAINKHLAPVLGPRVVSKIMPEEVQAAISGLSVSSKSARSKILNFCRAIFEVAVDNNIISKNPAAKIKAGGEKAAEKVPLTDEQQKHVILNTEGQRIHTFIMLGLFAGLRREEILGLQWDAVYLDVPEPYLEVKRACKYNESVAGIVSGLLKSDAAYRLIPLPAQLAAVLRAEKAKTKGPFVCGGDKHWSMQQFRNAWHFIEKRTCHEVTDPETGKLRMLKIGEALDNKHPYVKMIFDFYFTPHILRHTYITRLCASGMDLKKIQYLAGHADVQMTLNIYTHVVGHTPKELGSAVQSAFSG